MIGSCSGVGLCLPGGSSYRPEPLREGARRFIEVIGVPVPVSRRRAHIGAVVAKHHSYLVLRHTGAPHYGRGLMPEAIGGNGNAGRSGKPISKTTAKASQSAFKAQNIVSDIENLIPS